MVPTEPLYRIFYLNRGKYFVSRVEGLSLREAITKQHENFRDACLWFSFEEALKIIKHNRSSLETWGIVDANGVQMITGKFDGLLRKA